MRVTRRGLLAGGSAVAGLGAMPGMASAAAKAGGRAAGKGARYVRHDVASAEGQRMLEGYAKAVGHMLSLPADHPHNWFRNAFVHFMDCPHGNWWFYVWHRGFVGFVEQTVRHYSGMDDFAFPYWDWTENPALPQAMFKGPLTPVADAFAPYTRDLPTFTAFIQPALKSYWSKLNKAQQVQQGLRGNKTFDDLWNGVTGNNGSDPGDQAFAATARARYPTANNAALPQYLADMCDPAAIALGLAPKLFNAGNKTDSFTSSRTASHNAMPGQQGMFFSLLEGNPHNKIHNYIGGAFDSPDSWGDGPFGNMTNNLSPVDPIFFLHHSNMDRLWWEWEGKQRQAGLPTLPTDPTELAQFKSDPFLFFWRADGTPVLDGKAGDYIDPARFDYRYEAPVGQRLMAQIAALATMEARSLPAPRLLASAPTAGAVDALGDWPLGFSAQQLYALITFDRPTDRNSPREFVVLLNAPDDVKTAPPGSPYYAGSVAFFGAPMPGMTHRSTFIVPLPPSLVTKAGGRLELRLAPPSRRPDTPAPIIQALEIRGA